MELSKNIFFNTDKLVENSKVKISYLGKLYQDGSDVVSIHYGFGSNWDNVTDIKMENGYIVVDEHHKTNIKGVYASGDVTKKDIYQIVNAASEGAEAVVYMVKYPN